MTANRDITPPWAPGMSPIEGAAAHPSLQRLRSDAIHLRLADVREQRSAALADLPECEERAELVALLDRRVAAMEQALRWREGKP